MLRNDLAGHRPAPRALPYPRSTYLYRIAAFDARKCGDFSIIKRASAISSLHRDEVLHAGHSMNTEDRICKNVSLDAIMSFLVTLMLNTRVIGFQLGILPERNEFGRNRARNKRTSFALESRIDEIAPKFSRMS